MRSLKGRRISGVLTFCLAAGRPGSVFMEYDVKKLVFVYTLLCSFVAASCGGSGGVTPLTPLELYTPQVTSIDTSVVTVGQTMYVYGENFLHPEEGDTYLVFDGVYYWEDDQGNLVPEVVSNYRIKPLYDGYFPKGATDGSTDLAPGTSILRWNRFGPFSVPFGGGGNHHGTFQGSITAVNIVAGTAYTSLAPKAVTIDVEPSILITKLEPVIDYDAATGIKTAECGSPALRALGGLPYVLEVEAMGFEPKYFIYEISNINGALEWTSFTHQASGNVDRLGDPSWHANEIFVFNQLTDNDEFSIASIRVTAVDANDNHYETAMPINVVRPIHFHYDGNREIAEYYEPEMVHGPIVGSIGTTITYSETHSEARQKAVSMAVNKSFSQSQGAIQAENWSEAFSESKTISTTNTVGQSHSESESTSETYGTTYASSSANATNVSSTDGTSWGWNNVNGQSQETFENKMKEAYGSVSGSVTTTAGAEGSIPGFAKVNGSIGTTVGAETGGKLGNTTGEKIGTTSSYGTHMDGSASETVGFGSTTTDSASESLSGGYGLVSQSTINNSTAQTSAASNSTTYQMGGSASISENFTTGSSESWSETFVSTETDTSLLSFSGKVPFGRCAVVYRQTVRHVRTAQLYSYDLCGVRTMVGELSFNEWSWSPNIALGDDCELAIPEPTLPRAACFLACD